MSRPTVLSQDDLDTLRHIATWTGSHDLYFIVKGHVEATLTSMDLSSRTSLLMRDGRYRRAYTHAVQAVFVKLSDGGVIQISVDTTYVTRTAHFAGHVKDKEVEEQHGLYVVRCNDNSLYCGVSKRRNRVAEHNGNSRGAKYTRSRRPVTLIKEWEVGSRSEALRAEKRFKKLSKQKKEEVCQ